MSGTHGIFQHRPGYFFTILEEDLCEVFKKDKVNEVCRAYITSILEHLTNKQYDATGNDEDIWVYMSLPEMARRMRHAYSERTIHKEIQGMVKDGYLSKRRAYAKATMEYKLSLKRIRKALEALPDKQSCNSATSDLANLQEPSSNSARLILQNSKNDLANLQPRVPREKPIDQQIEQEEGTGAVAQPTREEHLALKEKIRDTDYRLKAIAKGDTHGHVNATSPAHSPGPAVPARPAGVTPVDVATRPAARSAGAAPPATRVEPAATQTSGGRELERAAKGTPTAPVATQKRLSLKDETPRPTHNRKEQERINDGVIADYWRVIEAWKGHKYSQVQRDSTSHKSGIEAMLADGILPDAITAKLAKLDSFQRRTFTVNRLYLDWWNNLDEAQPVKPAVTNGKPGAQEQSRPARTNFTQLRRMTQETKEVGA